MAEQLLRPLTLRRSGAFDVAVFDYRWFCQVMEGGDHMKPQEWACLVGADVVLGGIDFTFDYW